MEATKVFWGYLRIMENNREATNYSILAILGLYMFFIVELKLRNWSIRTSTQKKMYTPCQSPKGRIFAE